MDSNHRTAAARFAILRRRRTVSQRRTKDFNLLRPGMAPLEFVMALPLLLVLTYLILIIFLTFGRKLEMVGDVRRDVFQRLPSAQPSQPLDLHADALDGAVQAKMHREVDWGRSAFRFDVSATLLTTGGTWDARSIPFGQAPRVPSLHLAPAVQLLSGSDVSDELPFVSIRYARQFDLAAHGRLVEDANKASTMSGPLAVFSAGMENCLPAVADIEEQLERFLQEPTVDDSESLRRHAQQAGGMLDWLTSAVVELPRALRGEAVSPP